MTTSPIDAALNVPADFDAAPRIVRDVDAAVNPAGSGHDLIVVGGGIYGVCVALEAALRGLRPLLLEREDFGGATSWSSLRIVHGGLRYLQKLDLHRFGESVPERRWFGLVLPDLVRPLTCLMPLYGDGLRKPAIFRVALAMNDWLSRRRNEGLRADATLGCGRIIRPDEVMELFAKVDPRGLRGGGLWHDAYMVSSERVLIELLRWACCAGAQALNYVSAEAIVVEGGRVGGVEAVDHATGRTLRLRAPRVVNCSGPWSRLVSGLFDREVPRLIHPSLAFNLMLDRPALSRAAVAVAPQRKGARTYFVLPWKGRVFAGTSHLPWSGGLDRIGPSEEQIGAMLDDLNEAIPGFGAVREHVMRVYAGIVPAEAEGSDRTSDREVLVDHGAAGGPSGLVSVSGVKYTTARLVAEKTLRLAYGSSLPAVDPTRAVPPPGAAERFIDIDTDDHPHELARIAAEESVVHVDDLLLRRVDLTVHPHRARALAAKVCDALQLDDDRRLLELMRFESVLRGPAFGGPTDAARLADNHVTRDTDPAPEVCRQ